MEHNSFEKASRRLPDVISEAELQQIVSATKRSNHRIAFALGFYQAIPIS